MVSHILRELGVREPQIPVEIDVLEPDGIVSIKNLYRNVLGREPEPGAAEGGADRLANGSTLAQERQIMENSEEATKRRGQ